MLIDGDKQVRGKVFTISRLSRHRRRYVNRGFTLVELLIVIAVISVVVAILLPTLYKVRQQAREVMNAVNHRTVGTGVTLYSTDNRDRFPESVATIGFGKNWRWQEPRIITGFEQRAPQFHRAMSEYLQGYIEDAHVLQCPNTRRPYTYLDQAWHAGDAWDNPLTPLPRDPVVGSYNVYWHYTGHLKATDRPFQGPRYASETSSSLLTSDYIGYDHWLSPGLLSSCERLPGGSPVAQTWISAALWSAPVGTASNFTTQLELQLKAGFTDGHVSSYSLRDSVTLQVSSEPDGSAPYPASFGTGDIFIPKESVGRNH